MQNQYAQSNTSINSYGMYLGQNLVNNNQQPQIHESSTPASNNRFSNHHHPVVHHQHNYNKGGNAANVSRSQPAWSHAVPLAGDDSNQVVMPEIAESVFSKEEDDDGNGYGTSQNVSPDCKPQKFNVSLSGF